MKFTKLKLYSFLSAIAQLLYPKSNGAQETQFPNVHCKGSSKEFMNTVHFQDLYNDEAIAMITHVAVITCIAIKSVMKKWSSRSMLFFFL